MTLVRTEIEPLQDALRAVNLAGKSIGLVPTMGALHEGHASLFRAARNDCDFVVATVFVNPTQFGPSEDFTAYPRTWAADLALCEFEKVDVIFAPDRQMIYPLGYATYVEVRGLQDGLCGASRPGHFRGVATVVLKLFHIVRPDVAYFGQKDAQQVRVIQQMARDLNLNLRIHVCPIVRETDGLALSSRNRYLDANQRRHAPVLFRSLTDARLRIEVGERDVKAIRRRIATEIDATPGAALDYVEIVDAETLKPLTLAQGRILIALAVRFGSTRLIDNVEFDVTHASMGP